MDIWAKNKTPVLDKWKKYWFDIHPPHIASYSWNYLFYGGKEIRPTLFCELWNYLSPDSEINYELAFAIECIHIASIVLDDTTWMDNAKERRGKQTLHNVFSPKIALFIVNNILVMVINIWNNNKPTHIPDNIWREFLISKLHKLTRGQSLDLEKKGNLIELASLKTGVLFELVTETTAICLELDRTFWLTWGNNLGILFQWVDDYLDMNEDIIQKNRNAFNESYETTLENYINIWKKIEKEIGPQWFEKSFGMFMKTYFINQLNINIDSINYSSLSEIFTSKSTNFIIPEIPNDDNKFDFLNNFIKGLSRNNIINRIHSISSNIFSLSVITEQQWNNS